MSRTQAIGKRTRRPSKSSIDGKDPNYDYAFKRKEDAESGALEQEGWSVVRGNGVKDEAWHNPYEKNKRERTKGTGQFALQDTILCKRHKEESAHWKGYEDDKYNQQMKLVRDAAPSARIALRKQGTTGITITDQSKFTQKTGPTEAK